jgi:hypothetical protein
MVGIKGCSRSCIKNFNDFIIVPLSFFFAPNSFADAYVILGRYDVQFN